ncbi:MAG: hypothetical protein DRP76_00640, partial [Candidatus Omnitrophota bacterium]
MSIKNFGTVDKTKVGVFLLKIGRLESIIRFCKKGGKMKKIHRSKLFDNMVILNELLKDCRRSMNSIAKACCKNKQQVWRRIKKLEEENVI